MFHARMQCWLCIIASPQTNQPTNRPNAGHDYLDCAEMSVVDPSQDWSLCMDGTVHKGAVRGAVNDFAARVQQPVVATTHDGPWRSWLIMKPVCPGEQ